MKLEVNHKKKFGKTSNAWRLKNILIQNEWVNQEMKEEITKYMEANENEWKHNCPNPLRCSKGGPKRELYRNTGLPKEARKVSNTQTYT